MTTAVDLIGLAIIGWVWWRIIRAEWRGEGILRFEEDNDERT